MVGCPTFDLFSPSTQSLLIENDFLYFLFAQFIPPVTWDYDMVGYPTFDLFVKMTQFYLL